MTAEQMVALAAATRVLASMLLGAPADEIHARQPGWSLLALRVAEATMRAARDELAGVIVESAGRTSQ